MGSLSSFELLYSALVLLVAFAVRGAVGFGSSIVAIPLLALRLPLRTIVPVIALLSITAAIGQSVKDRQMIRWTAIAPLMLPTLLGILAGLYLFRAFEQTTLRKFLGLFVVGYAAHTFLAPRIAIPFIKVSLFSAIALGAPAGLITTLFGGMAGPLFVIYLDLYRLEKTPFRATISALFLLNSGLRVIGYFVSGFYDLTTLLVFAAAMPVMVFGMTFGDRIHIKLGERTFREVIGTILLCSGLVLMLK